MSDKYTKKIVFVATSVPDKVGGAPIRNYFLLKALSAYAGAKVDLFCLSEKSKILSAKHKIESELNIDAHIFPYRERTLITKVVAVLIDRMQPYMTEYRRRSDLGGSVWKYCKEHVPDVVQIEQIDAYYCLEPYIDRLKKLGIKVVLDAHNVETHAYRGAILTMPYHMRKLNNYLVPELKKIEDQAVAKSDLVLACSSFDAEYFSSIVGKLNVKVVPNGVDCTAGGKQQKRSKKLQAIFIGGTGYPPNLDALEFYLSEIHPLLSNKYENYQFVIVGGGTKEWLQSKNQKGDSVVAHGFVDSIEPYLARASIGICPVRQGSGTRIKLLTYMAAGIPVVSTSKGAEGINYQDGQNILIADSSVNFASEVGALLNDGPLRSTIGSNARSLMKEEYDWLIIGKNLRTHYNKLLIKA